MAASFARAEVAVNDLRKAIKRFVSGNSRAANAIALPRRESPSLFSRVTPRCWKIPRWRWYSLGQDSTLALQPFIALTDKAWFDFLSAHAEDGRIDEVNFRSPKSTSPMMAGIRPVLGPSVVHRP
jgi:hypothetical protein